MPDLNHRFRSQQLSPYLLKRDRFSSHYLIADWIRRFKRFNLPNRECVVLDVGCSEGFLRYFLDSASFYLIGIDKDLASIRRVREGYHEAIQADIEHLPILNLNRKPDVVVLADVLEHCRDPESVFVSLSHNLIEVGAKVIICLPNVANLYVRLSLLFGHFNYTDRGILDQTHMRFFTMKTGLELCNKCGVYVDELKVTPIPLPLIHPIFSEGSLLSFMHSLNSGVTSIMKSLLSYQIIFYGTYRG